MNNAAPKTILIIEDEEDIRNFYSETISHPKIREIGQSDTDILNL